jgi:hypothetical protein
VREDESHMAVAHLCLTVLGGDGIHAVYAETEDVPVDPDRPRGCLARGGGVAAAGAGPCEAAASVKRSEASR